jgi:hypothetical protein
LVVRTDIENTLHRYALGFDADDLDLLAGCFTPQAELSSRGSVTSGRDAIREAMVQRRKARADRGEQPRHVTTNVIIEPSGEDAARVQSYFTLTVATASGFAIAAMGRYEDEFVRVDGSWQIRRRTTYSDAVG